MLGNSMFLSLCYMHTLEMLSYTLHFTRILSTYLPSQCTRIVLIVVPGQYYHSSLLVMKY